MAQSRRQVMGAVAGAMLAPWALGARAAVVAKPARVLLGFAPGASADMIARTLAQQLGAYAPAVYVEHKVGAGGRIAMETLRTAEPDGSTLLVTPSAMVVLYPHVYKKLNYEPLKDFAPVAELCSFPFILVVGPMVPPEVTTLAQFITWCKANPKQAAFASSGSGTIPHFLGTGLARAAQVDLTHVPYKGGAPAMNDVMGGQIASTIAVVSNALPLLQGGKVRALAVTGERRAAALPNVPTLIEAGYPDLQGTESFGVFLPARTPADVVSRLHALVRTAMLTPAMQEVLVKASFEASPDATTTQYAQSLKTKHDRWGRMVKDSGFTPED